LSSKPSIIGPSNVNHGAVDLEEQKGDRGAAGARQARDESRDTKTFLKKLRATERGRGEQKNYKHAHTAKKQEIYASITDHHTMLKI